MKLFPYLVLLRMGFAERACHQAVGELLPHRFTLTFLRVSCEPLRLAVYSLLHFPSGCPAWPLASILPYEVRTFLSPTGASTNI